MKHFFRSNAWVYACFVLVFASMYPYGMLNLVLLLVMLYFSMWLHELGHTVAALLMGFDIWKIELGVGRELWTGRVGEVTLVLKTGFGGIVHLARVTPNLLKLRYFIFVAGGIVANVTAAIYIWFNKGFSLSGALSQPLTPAILILANAFSAIVALVPKLPFTKSVMPSDGWQLENIHRMGMSTVSDLLSLACRLEARELLEQRCYEQALDKYEQCLKEYPLSTSTYIGLSRCLSTTMRLDEALEVLYKTEHDYGNLTDMAVIKNNMAWIFLLRGDTQSMDLAMTLADQAVKQIPHKSYEQTRACILIETGKTGEGLGILLRQVDQRRLSDKDANPPSTLLYVALAHFTEGRSREGHKYLEIVDGYAHLLDPDDNHLRERITDRISNKLKPFFQEVEEPKYDVTPPVTSKRGLIIWSIMACLFAFVIFSEIAPGYRSPDHRQVVEVSSSDVEMNQAIAEARDSLEYFWSVYDNPAEAYYFCLKIALPDTTGLVEHIWVDDIHREGGKVYGLIANNPVFLKSVVMGQEIEILNDLISDWSFMRGGRQYGSYTVRVLLERLPREQGEALRLLLSDHPR